MNSRSVAVAAAASIIALTSGAAVAANLPAVKTDQSNKVPECATPGRMMAYLAERNPRLDPRFAGVATAYMRHGEALGIRWDYAFFQMILETGSLAYKRGNGQPGDVKPSQNNFAGLGATGNGAPGETFANIDDGVKAHLQHLLMYTGAHVGEPVAVRTRNVQEWGLLKSWQRGFKRPITFADIAGKWAPGSRGYVSNIQSIGSGFYDEHCQKADPKPELVREARSGLSPSAVGQIARAQGEQVTPARGKGADLARQALERAREEQDGQRSSLGARGAGGSLRVLNEPKPDQSADDAPAQGAGNTVTAAAVPPRAPSASSTPPAAAQMSKCRVWTASYGGPKAVVIRSISDQFTNFTVLDVNEGQEAREVEAYISAYAKGGQKVGDFSNSASALEKAFQLCPEG